MKKTLILGASTNPERYAYMAAQKLLSHGHDIVLFGNKNGKIFGQEILNNLSDIPTEIDTVTMYLGEKNQEPYMDFIKKMKPRRIIFNPGAEAETFEKELEKAGIEVLEACTLVMLQTKQY